MYKVLGADQREYGPVGAEQLQQWIAQGRANAQTRVQPVGAADWKPLAEFPEFAEALGQAAQPRPGAPIPVAPALPVSPAVPARTSGLAITSLILGILGLFSCGVTALVGLVFGIVALVKIDRSQGQLGGKGLALAGMIVSGVFVLFMPVFAAMFIPAMARAMQKAEIVRCMSNVRQLDMGFIMYANAHEGQLPTGNRWCEAVQPYVGASTNVFVCVRGKAGRQTHYAFNSHLAGVDTKSLSSPTTTVLVFEANGGWDLSGGNELLPPLPRHKGGYVIGFADGHAEAVRAEQLGRLRWDP